MMRLDDEITTNLEAEDEKLLLDQVQKYIESEDPDIIIFEDYNKGVLTESLIQEVTKLCRKAGVLTAVDRKEKTSLLTGTQIFLNPT